MSTGVSKEDILAEARVSVKIRSPTRPGVVPRDVPATLNLRISKVEETDSSAHTLKRLFFRFTQDGEPQFLVTIDLTEAGVRNFKTLTVPFADFHGFLLERFSQNSGPGLHYRALLDLSGPKKSLTFTQWDGATQLPYFSLPVVKGSDCDVAQYLGECFLEHVETIAGLQGSLAAAKDRGASLESSLTSSSSATQQEIGELKMALENLQVGHEKDLEGLRSAMEADHGQRMQKLHQKHQKEVAGLHTASQEATARSDAHTTSLTQALGESREEARLLGKKLTALTTKFMQNGERMDDIKAENIKLKELKDRQEVASHEAALLVSRLEGTVAATKREVVDQRALNDELRGTVERERAARDASGETVSLLRGAFNDLQTRFRESQHQVRLGNEALSRAEAMLKQKKARRGELKAKLSEAHNTVKRMTAEKSSDSLGSSELKHKLRELQQTNEHLAKEIKESYSTNEQAEHDLKSKSDAIEHLNREVSTLRLELARRKSGLGAQSANFRMHPRVEAPVRYAAGLNDGSVSGVRPEMKDAVAGGITRGGIHPAYTVSRDGSGRSTSRKPPRVSFAAGNGAGSGAGSEGPSSLSSQGGDQSHGSGAPETTSPGGSHHPPTKYAYRPPPVLPTSQGTAPRTRLFSG